MSKAWERRGLGLAAARALVNAGILTVEDLQTAGDLELASIPRIGSKSIAMLSKLRTVVLRHEQTGADNSAVHAGRLTWSRSLRRNDISTN